MGHLSINMENRKSVLKNSNLRKDNESQVYPSPLGFEISERIKCYLIT